MGDNEPESQSLSLQVQETVGWTRVLLAYCKEGYLGIRRAAGQMKSLDSGQSLWWLMRRNISMAWNSTLVCGARLSQQWSGACFSYTLTVVYPTLLSLSDKCLGTPDGKWGIFPGGYVWYMAVLLDTPAGKYGISTEGYLWVVPLCRHGYFD